MKGYLSEVFGSFEGEGDRVGMPAVFVRLGGCNLECSFCDTVDARAKADSATLYIGRRESRIANPVSPRNLLEIVGESFPGYRDVRFTGGEPLMQAGFVGAAAELLGQTGLGLHLETNGTLAAEMARLRHLFDTVTMDIKLPSTQDGKSLEAEHAAFLKVLAEGGSPPVALVKIVVTPECADSEVEEAFGLVAAVNSHVRVFLQPEFDETGPVVGGERMMRLLEAGVRVLHDVRISLQMHKILRMK
jgi:organic radical activating enzyme